MMERLATELLSKRTGLVAAWMQSKVGECRDCVDMVLTCEGDYYDPNFPFQLKSFNQKLLQILHADKDTLTIKKVEPWNSVKVTLNIPREAAIRLKTLAEEGNEALRSIGVLAVQVEGDRVISMTFKGRDDETAQVHFGSNLCLSADTTPPAVSSSHIQHKPPLATVLSGHFLKPRSAETSAIAGRSNGSVDLPQTFSNGMSFTCHPPITPRLGTAPNAAVATAVRLPTSHMIATGSIDTTLNAVVAAAVAISPRNSLTCSGRLPVSARSNAPKVKRIRKKKEPAASISANQSVSDGRAIERAELQQGGGANHLPTGFQRLPAYSLPSTGIDLTNGGPAPSSSAQNGCTQLSSRHLLETGKGELISANESIKAINDIITSLSASPSHHVHHQTGRPNLNKNSSCHGSHATSLSLPVLSHAPAPGPKNHINVIVKDNPTRPDNFSDIPDTNGCCSAGLSKGALPPADTTAVSTGQHALDSSSSPLPHIMGDAAAAAESNEIDSYSQQLPLLMQQQQQPLPCPAAEKLRIEARSSDWNSISSAMPRIPPASHVASIKSPTLGEPLDVDGPTSGNPDKASSQGLLSASCAVPVSLTTCPSSLCATAVSSATDLTCTSSVDVVTSASAGALAATDTDATAGQTFERSSSRAFTAGSNLLDFGPVVHSAPLSTVRGIPQLTAAVPATATQDASQPAKSRSVIVARNAHQPLSELVHTGGNSVVSLSAGTAAQCSSRTNRLGLGSPADEAAVVPITTTCTSAHASALLPTAMMDIPVSVACVAQRADEGSVDGASQSPAAGSSSDGLPPGDVSCSELAKNTVVILDEAHLSSHPSGDAIVQRNESPAVPHADAQPSGQLATHGPEEPNEGGLHLRNEGSLLYSRQCVPTTPSGLYEAFRDRCRAPEASEFDSRVPAKTWLPQPTPEGCTESSNPSDTHNYPRLSVASDALFAHPVLSEHTESGTNYKPMAVLTALPITEQSPSCARGAESPGGFERCMHGLLGEGESCSRCEASPGAVASALTCATDVSSAGDCSAAATDPATVLDLSLHAGTSAQPFNVEHSEKQAVCINGQLESAGSVESLITRDSPEQTPSGERLSSMVEDLSAKGMLQSPFEREQDTDRRQQQPADGDSRRPSSESAESGISLDECSSELLPILEPLAASSGIPLVQQAAPDPHDGESADTEPANSDASEKLAPCGLPYASTRLPSDRHHQRSAAGRGRPRGGAKRTYLLTIESNSAEVIIGDAVVDTGRLSISEGDSSEPKPKGRRGRKAQEFTRNGTLLSPMSATQFEPAKRSTRSHGAADLQALPTVYRERRKPLDKK